jgi:hypothetical protein
VVPFVELLMQHHDNASFNTCKELRLLGGGRRVRGSSNLFGLPRRVGSSAAEACGG